MKVLITGFAGSLGTAFAQFCLNRGDEVIGIDNNEWAVAAFPDHERLTKQLGDFDTGGVPADYGLIIHCAAYKHVDLIQKNELSAYANNVTKTRRFYAWHPAEPILFISTDKAVEHASFYGYTKKEGEEITKEIGGVIARLGNIMGSSGSVIPRWEKAIEDGEPLPITDPEMTRYMLPADEAVRKVMALYEHASPGQVIIPSMGEPKKLSELVQEFLSSQKLRLSYPTKIIGIRPGEKMHEKLKWDYEEVRYEDVNGEIVE